MMKKFKTWVGKIFGFVNKSEYDTLKSKYDNIVDTLSVNESKRKEATLKVEELKRELEEQPYDFKALINKYTERQLNAFVYEAINHARNHKDLRHLLQRWIKRFNNAVETIVDNPKEETHE